MAATFWIILALTSFVTCKEDPDHVLYIPPNIFYNTTETRDYWYADAQSELSNNLAISENTNVARNVILFIGDGMGQETVTAARIHGGNLNGENERNTLFMDSFPVAGASKTYNVDAQIGDGAGSSTAVLTGVKTNRGVVGVDSSVSQGDCEAMTADTLLENLIQSSQIANKSTGIVTTSRLTDATPAAGYAFSADRAWECDADIPGDVLLRCPTVKDIASQLADLAPGINLNVVLGGGFQYLDGAAVDLPTDPLNTNGCIRSDGRQIWQDWIGNKQSQGRTAAFVRTRTELMAVDLLNTTDDLMGVFANDDLPFGYEIDQSGLDVPSLAEMVQVAINILNKNPNGFFLLVENGNIDKGHHGSTARKALDETLRFDYALASTVAQMGGTDDTLIVATADHAHTLTINGYPLRTYDILNTTVLPGNDLTPYTTLSYSMGSGYNYTAGPVRVERPDPRDYDTLDFDYKQLSAVPLSSAPHGGQDVPIFAIGPMAHMLEGVNEQNFLAHVMGYASCVGANLGHCSP